jgi:hypothetical protein
MVGEIALSRSRPPVRSRKELDKCNESTVQFRDALLALEVLAQSAYEIQVESADHRPGNACPTDARAQDG